MLTFVLSTAPGFQNTQTVFMKYGRSDVKCQKDLVVAKDEASSALACLS